MAVSGAGMMGDGGDGLAEAAMAADVPAKGRIEALGGMVIALGVNEQASKVLSESPKNEKKLAFQSCLALFAHHVHLHDPALASRLEGLRQQYLSQQSPKSQRRGLKSEAEMDGIIMGMGDGSDSMPQPAGARAHLFVWLEGLVNIIIPRLESD